MNGSVESKMPLKGQSTKIDWPWTEASKHMQPLMPDGRQWPKISIVTPSFNQGQFLEETIRSVLLQNYPNLEYIIIDGGSTDNSVEIIKKYEKYLTYWVSEKDNGQSQAINKGFKKATGDIYGWLNSDDLLTPDALHHVATSFSILPEPIHWIVGKMIIFTNHPYQEIQIKEPSFPDTYENWLLQSWFSPQPSTFWSREAWLFAGLLREDLHYSFDREYWLRLKFFGYQPKIIPQILSKFRHHGSSKTILNNNHFVRERNIIRTEYASKLEFAEYKRVLKLVKKVDIQLRISDINRHPKHDRVSNFLTLLSVSPCILFQKQFWGALARVLGLRKSINIFTNINQNFFDY